MGDISNSKLLNVVETLPELYQPIYGHGELKKNTSRECINRLAYVQNIYQAYERIAGRCLRVLDLGCAQGFMTFSIAEWGASVTGIDFGDENITLCRLLAEENLSYDVKFHKERIESFIYKIQRDEYDIVIGLSVFHHLCSVLGILEVKNMISFLADRVAIGIFELALKDEPIAWASSLPEDYCELLSGYSCVRTLAHFSTHLSDVQRPFCFASSRFIYFLNQTLFPIDYYHTTSQKIVQDSHRGTRRYFVSGKYFIKFARLNNISLNEMHNIINYDELTQEAKILKKIGGKNGNPNLITIEYTNDEIWLVRDYLDGLLLSDMISMNMDYDPWDIIIKTLFALVRLEKESLYHDDLRVWNVLYTKDSEVHLLDYGAISEIKTDNQWPYDAVLSFFLFMHEVLSKKIRVATIRNVNFMTTLINNFSHEELQNILMLKDDNFVFLNLYNIISKREGNSSRLLSVLEQAVIALGDLWEYYYEENVLLKNRIGRLECELHFLKDKLRNNTQNIQMDDFLTVKNNLIRFTKRYSRVYLYGAGKLGRICKFYLEKENVKIHGYIVSNKTNNMIHTSECVYSVDEVDFTDDCGIVLSLSEKYHKDILSKLCLKTLNIFSLPDRFFYSDYVSFQPLIRFIESYTILPSCTKSWKSILVLRLDVIGDMVWTTAFLRELKKNFPNSHLTLVVREDVYPLMQYCPIVDELIPYANEMKHAKLSDELHCIETVSKRAKLFAEQYLVRRHYDAVFLPTGLLYGNNGIEEVLLAFYSNAKERFARTYSKDHESFLKNYFSKIVFCSGHKHEVLEILDLLVGCGCSIEDDRTELWVGKDEQKYSQEYFTAKGLNDKLVVAVGVLSRELEQVWDIDRYIEIFSMCYQKYGNKVQFMIFGAADGIHDKTIKNLASDNVINLFGKTSIAQLVAFIQRCDLYLGVNTGLLHIASAFHKSIIEIVPIFEGDNPYSGLIRVGAWKTHNTRIHPQYGLGDCYGKSQCKKKYAHCINQINVSEVIDVLDEYIEKELMNNVY